MTDLETRLHAQLGAAPATTPNPEALAAIRRRASAVSDPIPSVRLHHRVAFLGSTAAAVALLAVAGSAITGQTATSSDSATGLPQTPGITSAPASVWFLTVSVVVFMAGLTMAWSWQSRKAQSTQARRPRAVVMALLLAGFSLLPLGVVLVRGSSTPSGSVRVLVFSPDGQTLASSTYSTDMVSVWDIESQTVIRQIATRHVQLSDLAFNQTGTLLATTGRDGQTRVWDVAPDSGGREPTTFSTPGDPQFVSFSGNETLVIATTESVEVVNVETQEGEEVFEFEDLPHDSSGHSFITGVSPGGSTLFISESEPSTGDTSSQSSIHIWDIDQRRYTKQFDVPFDVSPIQTNLGSEQLAITGFEEASASGPIESEAAEEPATYIVDVKEGTSRSIPEAADANAPIGGGPGLVVVGEEDSATVWDAEELRPIAVLEVDGSSAFGVDQGGKLLAVGDDDGLVWVWQLKNNNPIGDPKLFTNDFERRPER